LAQLSGCGIRIRSASGVHFVRLEQGKESSNSVPAGLKLGGEGPVNHLFTRAAAEKFSTADTVSQA